MSQQDLVDAAEATAGRWTYYKDKTSNVALWAAFNFNKTLTPWKFNIAPGNGSLED